MSLAPLIMGAHSTTTSLDPVFVPLIIGAVFTLLGLIFFTIGRVRTAMCKGWLPTTAVIINSKGGTEGLPSRYPTFGYTGPDGTRHRKTSSVHGGFYRLGSYVPVLINPAHPERAVIDSFVQKLVIFTVIGAGMMIFGLVIAAFGGYLLVTR